jgi:two-component system chemotaxis response regulator CheB
MSASSIRVLVVDDSVVVRQVICDALRSDPAIEIVGVAQNGKVALEKLDAAKPDVITLDLEMPEMDGLATLDALRHRGSRVPVVVFSTLTERGARATLDALTRGANDYVCKPSGQKSLAATVETIRTDLLPRIHTLHERARRRLGIAPLAGSAALPQAPRTQPISQPLAPLPNMPLGAIDVITIGVSTGGPGALAEILPLLSPNLAQPVLIVQHMPPVFTRVLAQRLSEKGPLRVREAQDRDRLEPGTVLIAPGDYHMRIAGTRREPLVALDQQPTVNGCRPAIDPLFESAATIFGRGVLALVLTGLGQDGTRGATAVRKAGGHVWAQDEASSAAYSMPGSVVNAGLSNRVLPLAMIGSAISDAARIAPCQRAGSGPLAQARKLP